MKKRIIAKGILFITITALFMILYYRVLPIINKYGLQPFYIREYIYTEEYEKEVLNKLIIFESEVNKGITLEEGYNSNYLQIFNDSNFEYILDITKTTGEELIVSNLVGSKEELRNDIASFANGRAYYICKLNSAPNTSVERLKDYPFHTNQQVFSKLDVYVRIRYNLDKKDNLKSYKENYERLSKNTIVLMGICVVLLIIAVRLIVYLTKQKIEEGKELFRLFYWEEIILMVITVLMISMKMTGMTKYYSMLVSLPNWIKWIIYLICYFVLSEVYFCVVDRLKKGNNKNQFMFPKLLDNIKKVYQPFIAYCAINFMYYTTFFNNNEFIIVLCSNTMLLFAIFRYILEIERITKETKKIAEQKEEIAIETKYPRYKELADNLNEIQEGITKAVEEKMKSERLKTDLITNVSHDLKTPLTSIINYTNLLKKEEIQNEKAQKYITILEDKSKKLKALTEDLIDASRISSGNETVTLEELNFAEMILQANGEFAEKFDEKGLDLVSYIEKEEMYTFLDSKKMWRVLENIYGNVTKYALENTRIYVRLEESKGKIEFSMKNISKAPLDIAPDELMERFVRGDKSRTSTGNGLGLSIAKDLVELQNGKFEIFIEGDLFKVSIRI